MSPYSALLLIFMVSVFRVSSYDPKYVALHKLKSYDSSYMNEEPYLEVSNLQRTGILASTPVPEKTVSSKYHDLDLDLNNGKTIDLILSYEPQPANSDPNKAYIGKWNLVARSRDKNSFDDNLSKDEVFIPPKKEKQEQTLKQEDYQTVEPKKVSKEKHINKENETLTESTQKKKTEIKTEKSKGGKLPSTTQPTSDLKSKSLASDSSVNQASNAANDMDFSNHPSFGDEILSTLNSSFRSFIFNPVASPLESFQDCTTPKNETGKCRYVQHCLIPSIISSLDQFMNYVCIIEQRFIGVCCPKFPVSTLVIKWQNITQNSTTQQKPKNDQECGVGTNTRIVGGTDADPKAWPWMVALLTKGKKKFFCGGALINNQYVLTAAHCTFGVPNNKIIARLGEYDFRDSNKSSHDYAVVKIKRHGQYSRRTLRNDIALLKLEKPVVFNEFIKTICLPEGNSTYVGKNATLTGWGNLAGDGPTSDVLQIASFPIVTNEKCAESHGVPIPPSLICAESEDGDQGACNGDSGGPLMLLDNENRWKTIGVVSWGRRGCSPKFPTVYTRVSHYLEWIRKHSS